MHLKLSPDAVVQLDKTHDRTRFDCGSEPLNRYLQQQARQEMQRHVSVTFVLPDSEQAIRGFYTHPFQGLSTLMI